MRRPGPRKEPIFPAEASATLHIRGRRIFSFSRCCAKKKGHRLFGPPVPGEVAGGSLLGMFVRVPQPEGNVDSHSHLRRPGFLAGAEAAVEGTICGVAERKGADSKIAGPSSAVAAGGR